jgi:hypothetical protein
MTSNYDNLLSQYEKTEGGAGYRSDVSSSYETAYNGDADTDPDGFVETEFFDCEDDQSDTETEDDDDGHFLPHVLTKLADNYRGIFFWFWVISFAVIVGWVGIYFQEDTGGIGMHDFMDSDLFSDGFFENISIGYENISRSHVFVRQARNRTSRVNISDDNYRTTRGNLCSRVIPSLWKKTLVVFNGLCFFDR